jgi:hypothetical protein
MTDSTSQIPIVPFPTKTRVFILTDITNEPDDAESFCRYLTYSNQFETEGVVATTSIWLKDKVAPEKLHQIVNGYEAVVDKLNAHVHLEFPYPSADYFRAIIKAGAPVSQTRPLTKSGEVLMLL